MDLHHEQPIVNDENLKKIQEDVENLYIKEVHESIRGRTTWKRVGDACEALSMSFSGIASIAAFATGFYDIQGLAFAAGCCSTLALALLTYAGYAHRESKERTDRLNKTLDAVGIETIKATPTEGHREREDDREN
jgi:hypothetical protein